MTAPATRTPRPPIVWGRLLAPTRRGDPWTVVVTWCPFCGREHTHGAGMDGSTGAGLRLSHCALPGPRRDYRIAMAPDMGPPETEAA